MEISDVGDVENTLYGEIVADAEQQHQDALAEVYFADEAMMNAVKNGNPYSWESMIKTMLKVMVLIRHSEKKAHDVNNDITKNLIKVEVKNVVASYNGRMYIACQVATGAMNLGFGFLSATPKMAQSVLGSVMPLTHWDLNTNDGMRQFSKYVSKLGTQVTTPVQIGGQVCDNRDKCGGEEGRSNMQPMNTDLQTRGQESSSASQATKEMIAQIQRGEEQRNRLFSQMASPAA